LYHYFASKEALLIGVLEYATQIMHPVVMAPVEAATADPIGRIFELLANYRRGMEMWNCRMGCPIGNLALEVADDHPPARQLIDLNFRNWATVIRGWLDAAGDRLPPTADKDQLARFILTVMEGGIMQARAAGNVTPFDDSVGQLRAYFELLEAQAGKEAE
jgi:TetR/AcrR family transcriptional regulator, transcriptional repressor for nem operon